MNKVFLMGRLTKDPELRYTSQQTPVCSFSLAVDNGYGEHKKTDFLSCVAWNKTAEFVSKYFLKGQMLALEGRLSTRTWEGRDGKKNYATEVVVLEAHFCGGRERSAEEDGFTPLDGIDEDCPF